MAGEIALDAQQSLELAVAMQEAGNPPKGSPAALVVILRLMGAPLCADQVARLAAVADAALESVRRRRALDALAAQLHAREGWEERDEAHEEKVRRDSHYADDMLEAALLDLYGEAARDLDADREVEAILDGEDDEEGAT